MDHSSHGYSIVYKVLSYSIVSIGRPTHSLARLERHEQTKEGGIAIFFPSTQVSVRVEFRGASAHTKRSYMANSSLGGSSSPISLPWLRVTLVLSNQLLHGWWQILKEN
uniref:Uncharacterized protein n=1 Tax=Ammopiptanthus mongolicus TaxID=126911 RepID=A0A4P8PNT6_AMMMO|nr:hypothetical protein [Ammopiptanthus mongolicus]